MTPKPTVNEAFSAVMDEVQAVSKDGFNEKQKFKFRGVDAVMNAVGPALRMHGVIIIPSTESATYRDVEVGQNRTPMRECTIRVQYRIIGPAGDSIEGGAVFAEALDSGDKATAKAHSVAYRTFLLQALTIPTDEPDPDLHSVERAAPAVEESPYVSAANVEAMRQSCAAKGVDVADVMAVATDCRTSDPAELLKSEIGAARDALAQLAASTGAESTPAKADGGSGVEPTGDEADRVPAASSSSGGGK